MWDILLKDRLSLAKIADIANNEWGFRTRQKKKVGGGGITVSALHAMFHNPFYAGFIRFKGKLLPGNHSPMVTIAEFEEAQRILGVNIDSDRAQTKEFAYTGYVRCGECGCRITAERKVKTTVREKKRLEFTYYHCTHKKDDRTFKCGQRKNVNEKELERQIVEVLSSIEIHPEFVNWAKSVLHRLHDGEAKKQESVFDSLNKRIEDAKKKQSRLLSLLIAETISEEEYKTSKSGLEQELKLLEAQRGSSNVQTQNWVEVMENTLDFVACARQRFVVGDVATKKSIFRALGSNLILMDGKLNVELNSWFQPFTKLKKLEASPLSRLEPAKKGISLRKAHAFDGEKTEWLPEQDSNL
jgi:site-specific DNA recombinase